MKSANTFFMLGNAALISVLALCLAGCSAGNCPQGTNGSGSSTGGTSNSGGSGNGACVATNGGGGGGGGSSAKDFFFTFPGNGPSMQAASLTGTTLALLSGATLPSINSFTQNDMIVVNQNFLYVTGQFAGAGQIYGYTINHTTGSLASIAGNPVATHTQMGWSMATDPKGRFLYVGDGIGLIAGFTIDANSGALTPMAGSPFQLNAGGAGLPVSLTVDSSGNFLYVGQGPGARSVAGVAVVFGFSIDQSSGVITPISGSPFGLGVGFLQSQLNGNFVLGVSDQNGSGGSSTADDNVYVITVQPGVGTLGPMAGFTTATAPYWVIVHPNGKFVYTFENDTNGNRTAMEGFTLDASGNLTPMPGSPFSTLPIVASCKFDPAGVVAFCPDSSGTLYVFNVDQNTGVLTNTITPLKMSASSPFAVSN